MTMKNDLPNSNSGGSGNLTSEANYRDYLYFLYPRSTSGNVGFTSTTSGIDYTTAGSLYDSQGQEGLLLLLQDALDNYGFSASDYNELYNHLSLDASTSTKGHIQLASTTDITTGTDNTKAVTPAGLKATYIPLSQRGVASGVASLNIAGDLVQKPYVKGTYTGNFSGTVDAYRDINIGFTPSLVLVSCLSIDPYFYRDGFGYVRAAQLYPGINAMTRDKNLGSIITDGFRVWQTYTTSSSIIVADLNNSSYVYSYIAFK